MENHQSRKKVSMKLLSTERNVDASFSQKKNNKHREWDCYGQRSDTCVLTVSDDRSGARDHTLLFL